MPTRFHVRGIGLVVGIVATLLLAAVALLTWIPVHRSPIQIADPLDSEVEPDFDALLLRGHQGGGVYVVTLTVVGVVQASNYNVGVLVQDLGRPGDTYVYRLEFQFGEEESYGIPAIRDGNSLTFEFPLNFLSPNTYVVGLDAATFGRETNDYLVEGPREDLQIERLLNLPVDSGLLAVAAATLAILTIVGGTQAIGRVRRGVHGRE